MLKNDVDFQQADRNKILFHQLARNGILNTIDPSELTQENLLIENDCRDTVFHTAARNGHLNQIPKEFLTQENLTLTNLEKVTPLHWAALHMELDLTSSQA
jgi:hypothetical protein